MTPSSRSGRYKAGEPDVLTTFTSDLPASLNTARGPRDGGEGRGGDGGGGGGEPENTGFPPRPHRLAETEQKLREDGRPIGINRNAARVQRRAADGDARSTKSDTGARFAPVTNMIPAVLANLGETKVRGGHGHEPEDKNEPDDAWGCASTNGTIRFSQC